MIHKTSEINSSFYFEIPHYVKSLISLFQGFFASTKILILAKTLGTRLSFYHVYTFYKS